MCLLGPKGNMVNSQEVVCILYKHRNKLGLSLPLLLITGSRETLELPLNGLSENSK